MTISFTGRLRPSMGRQYRGDYQPVGRSQLPDRVRHCLLLQYRLPQLGLDAIDLGLCSSGELLQCSVVLDRGGKLLQ